MKMTAYYHSFFLLIGVSLSCSSPNSADLPLRAPGFSTPIVTGIYITTIDPTAIAVWGHPASPQSQSSDPGNGPVGDYTFVQLAQPTDSTGDSSAYIISPVQLSQSLSASTVPRQTRMDIPYPNPFNNSATIQFSIPVATNVDLWVVRARWIGDADNDMTSSSGALVISPQVLAITELIRNQTLAAGRYSVLWNGKGEDGQIAPTGFYRIYFKAGETLSWHDVLLYHQRSELPSDLLKLINP